MEHEHYNFKAHINSLSGSLSAIMEGLSARVLGDCTGYVFIIKLNRLLETPFNVGTKCQINYTAIGTGRY